MNETSRHRYAAAPCASQRKDEKQNIELGDLVNDVHTSINMKRHNNDEIIGLLHIYASLRTSCNDWTTKAFTECCSGHHTLQAEINNNKSIDTNKQTNNNYPRRTTISF